MSRAKAKKILYDELKYQGCEEIIFPDSKKTHSNTYIETIIDAMIKYKKTK